VTGGDVVTGVPLLDATTPSGHRVQVFPHPDGPAFGHLVKVTPTIERTDEAPRPWAEVRESARRLREGDPNPGYDCVADVSETFERISTELDALLYRVRRSGRSVPLARVDDVYDRLTELRLYMEEL
jgi:hypothetical protein